MVKGQIVKAHCGSYSYLAIYDEEDTSEQYFNCKHWIAIKYVKNSKPVKLDTTGAFTKIELPSLKEQILYLKAIKRSKKLSKKLNIKVIINE